MRAPHDGAPIRLDEGGVMAAHAGEEAQKTGDFHCAKCSEKVHVRRGEKIPKCPNGHTDFETRTGEPGNKS
jgi:ribosomal protein L37AE/L43A